VDDRGLALRIWVINGNAVFFLQHLRESRLIGKVWPQVQRAIMVCQIERNLPIAKVFVYWQSRQLILVFW
jgi:hypothetical protein